MKDYNRRDFIHSASILLAAGTVLKNDFSMKKTKLVHHVFFWLKNPGSAADRDQLIEGLLTLKKIKGINELLIGVPASTEKREVVDSSYDVSELMYFDDVKAQDAYQADPIHTAFVAKYSHLWQKVVVYDMITV